MINALRLRMTRSRALPSFDPAGVMIRMDAAYRERRRMQDVTSDQLADVGLTRADVDRIFGQN
jgi:uncharacterized protein YjiS (DUF1127 family)